MATRFYEPIGGGDELKLWADPDTFVEADLQAELSELLELQALSEEARDLTGCPELTRDDFDIQVQERIDTIRDILDFFDYEDKVLNITAKDGAWFLPEAIESICGEEVGFEGSKMIDDNIATYWQHDVNEEHNVVLRLRDYRKRITKIRIRRSANPRSALNNLDIYVADNINQLDNPDNLAIAGASISVDNDWNEIVFSSSQRGKYIRLTGFGSAHATNEVRIREIEAWVTIVEYN